ncbi:MAG: TlpA family protein disulfide reductase [Janthinobacterium lividum]
MDFGDSPARDHAVFWLLWQQLATNPPGALAAYPAFRAHNRDSTLARRLRKAITTIEARPRIQPGQLAPVFSLVDAAGHPVSLSDFRGKVIYLDFWGTWCAPCLAEMPTSEALRQHFAGREVAFVYISVNDTQAKWHQMLMNRHLDTFRAVQLWSSTVGTAQAYSVPEYPCYYLIGRDGRFVTIHPPRPSNSKEAIAAIEQALAR